MGMWIKRSTLLLRWKLNQPGCHRHQFLEKNQNWKCRMTQTCQFSAVRHHGALSHRTTDACTAMLLGVCSNQPSCGWVVHGGPTTGESGVHARVCACVCNGAYTVARTKGSLLFAGNQSEQTEPDSETRMASSLLCGAWIFLFFSFCRHIKAIYTA